MHRVSVSLRLVMVTVLTAVSLLGFGQRRTASHQRLEAAWGRGSIHV